MATDGIRSAIGILAASVALLCAGCLHSSSEGAPFDAGSADAGARCAAYIAPDAGPHFVPHSSPCSPAMQGFALPDLDVHAGLLVDVDGDGKKDLVSDHGALVYEPGRGDGTFGAPRLIVDAGALFVSGDWNGDGRTDFALGSGPTFVLQLPDGGFSVATASTASHDADSMVAADFEGEGRSTLVLASDDGRLEAWVLADDGGLAMTSSVSIRSGNSTVGVGTLNAGEAPRVFTFDGQLLPLRCGIFGAPISLPARNPLLLVDVDGDGHGDEVGPFGYYRGFGDGGFSGLMGVFFGSDLSVTAADVDGDGKLELVTVERDTSLVQVWAAIDGGLAATARYLVGSSQLNGGDQFEPASVQLADLDGDGAPEAVVDNHVMHNDGTGRFEAPRQLFSSNSLATLSSARLDGQTQPSIFDGSAFFTPLDDGGWLRTPSPVEVTSSEPSWLGDANGDGKLDLLRLVSNSPSLLFNGFLGDGGIELTRAVPLGSMGQAVIAGLGSERGGEIAVGESERIEIFGFTSTGTLTSRQVFDGGAAGLSVGDVDGDGMLDLVASGARVFFDRDGGFVPGATGTVDATGSASLGDFDGDGVLDLAATVGGGFGAGDGSFAPDPVLSHNGFLADVDGDGRADLVVGHTSSPALPLKVTWGASRPGPWQTVAVPTGAGQLTSAALSLSVGGQSGLAFVEQTDFYDSDVFFAPFFCRPDAGP